MQVTKKVTTPLFICMQILFWGLSGKIIELLSDTRAHRILLQDHHKPLLWTPWNILQVSYILLMEINEMEVQNSRSSSSSYVLGLLYSKYSLSTCSEPVLPLLLCVWSGFSFTSGNISTSQASPPSVSHASAGNTLQQQQQKKRKKVHAGNRWSIGVMLDSRGRGAVINCWVILSNRCCFQTSCSLQF